MLPNLKIWLNHFEYHAQHPRRVPAGLSDVLKPEERRLIARSISAFQLGEQSEGNAECEGDGDADGEGAEQLAGGHASVSMATVRRMELAKMKATKRSE